MKRLRNAFSEYGLIRWRVSVECRWLQQLSQIPQVSEVPAFSPEATALLDDLSSNFSVAQAAEVKQASDLSCPHLPGAVLTIELRYLIDIAIRI